MARGPGNAALAEQGIDARARRFGNGKRKVRGPGFQAEHRADAEITVDRMDIERRHRNVVRVGEPAPLARSLPGMLARLGRKASRRSIPDACARPVETDPHRRTARQYEHGGPELAVHVDDEVVGVGAQLCREPPVIDKRRQRPRLRPIVAREFDDVGDSRIMPQQFGDGRRDQPIDLRGRVAPPQSVEHGDGMHNIADGRQFDQQNFAKVAALQVGRRQAHTTTPVAADGLLRARRR
jgi:hypothetical protein